MSAPLLLEGVRVLSWLCPHLLRRLRTRLLLAFSCKTRYFCPSCHQKRVLLYGEWVEETVLAPVPHRQYVFTVPRLVRHFFARRREWLGELCRIAERLLSEYRMDNSRKRTVPSPWHMNMRMAR